MGTHPHHRWMFKLYEFIWIIGRNIVRQFFRRFCERLPREQFRKQSIWRLELSLVSIYSFRLPKFSIPLFVVCLQDSCQVVAKFSRFYWAVVPFDFIVELNAKFDVNSGVECQILCNLQDVMASDPMWGSFWCSVSCWPISWALRSSRLEFRWYHTCSLIFYLSFPAGRVNLKEHQIRVMNFGVQSVNESLGSKLCIFYRNIMYFPFLLREGLCIHKKECITSIVFTLYGTKIK